MMKGNKLELESERFHDVLDGLNKGLFGRGMLGSGMTHQQDRRRMAVWEAYKKLRHGAPKSLKAMRELVRDAAGVAFGDRALRQK